MYWFSNNINIEQNTFLDLAGTGIYIYYFSDYITVNQNSIRNTEYGIYSYNYNEYTTIVKNEVSNCSVLGLYVRDHCGNGSISENSLFNNAMGLYLWTEVSNMSVTYNQIYNNDGIGLRLSNNANNNFIFSNLIFGNTGNGIDSQGATGNLYYFNNIFDNQGLNGYAISGEHFNTSSVGNYWGDYTGIDANQDGIGDSAYNLAGGSNKDYRPLINYQPWILFSPLECYYQTYSALPELTWKIIDDFIYLGTYEISINNIKIESGSFWKSGDIISLDLNTPEMETLLSVISSVTIEFFDGSGKSCSQTLILNLTEPLTPDDSSNDESDNADNSTTTSSNNSENELPSNFDIFLDKYSILAVGGVLFIAILGSAFIKRK